LRPVICRTLKREFRLHPPTEAIGAQLAFVAAEPDLPGQSLEPVDIPIRLRDGFLVASAPGGEIIEGTPGHLIGAMHRIVLADLIEGDPDVPFIHGATVVVGGRRLLLVGHKGCGKSTLALHLVMAGHDIEGDEHLMVREGEVIARPRTLRVKQGTLSLVAGLPAAVAEAPLIVNWDGTTIRSISPTVGGRPWVIRAGRLDAVVFLVANHGGHSAAKRVTGTDAFARLMREILLPQVGIAAATGRLRRLAFESPAHQLLLGDIYTAEWHLRSIANQLT
jgi:hypothetical protein